MEPKQSESFEGLWESGTEYADDAVLELANDRVGWIEDHEYLLGLAGCTRSELDGAILRWSARLHSEIDLESL
jgi:hypothetical protein